MYDLWAKSLKFLWIYCGILIPPQNVKQIYNSCQVWAEQAYIYVNLCTTVVTIIILPCQMFVSSLLHQ